MLTTACPTCGATVPAAIQYCQQCGSDVRAAQEALDTADIAQPAPVPRPPDLMELLTQATQGEYHIISELGRGGMATVFLADDLALDRKVAIKVMSPGMFSGGDLAERFKREARTVGGLSHPHVIPIYSVRETPQLLFFVMKYVEGRGLDQILKEFGALPVRMVQAILSQVGSALHHAHRKQIVHRDVKPANIMLDDDGWAVVTDFGIAKVARQVELTKTGSTVGTPYYMSPEQCSGTAVTSASDQYSLGIVAYEMLTGRVPFRGASIMDIMRGHFVETPPPITELRRDCPAELAQIVMRMLAKEAVDRYPSLDDVISAIDLAPLSVDDPTRTQMVEMARSGARSRPSLPAGQAPLPRPRSATSLQNARPPNTRRPSSRSTATGSRSWKPLLFGVAALAFIAMGWGLSLALLPMADRSDSPRSQPQVLGSSAHTLSDTVKTPATPVSAPVDSGSPAPVALTKPDSGQGPESSQDSAVKRAPTASTRPPAPSPSSTQPARTKRSEPELDKAADPEELMQRVRDKQAVRLPAVTPTPGPAPAKPQPVTVPQTANIKISTRSPNAKLYIDGQPYPLGSALTEFPVRPGIVELRIIADGCEPEDRTDTVAAGTTKTIGRFNARCP